MGHLRDLLSRLDEDRLRRGKQFERICKWFLTNDPLYQHQVRHVWLWDEWPGRWGAICREFVSAPGKIRTCDLSLRRRALYPLSYGRRRRREDDISGHGA
jgi:hypothetical protein